MACEMVLVNCDGGSRGNPGPAAIGVVVWDEKRRVLKELGERIGITTSNVAEYKALAKALELASAYTHNEVHVFMDSELVARQVKGLYKVKASHLLPLLANVKRCEGAFRRVVYSNVPREDRFQSEADRLVNEALGSK